MVKVSRFRKREPKRDAPPADQRDVSKASLAAPIDDVRFTVLDTELTGLDKNEDTIISIGAVKMVGGRIKPGESFYEKVKPHTEIGHASVRIHQITPSEVSRKPPIDDILGDFIEFCGDDVLVGHFISLDMHFINKEASRVFGAPLPNPVVDTLQMLDWIKKHNDSFGQLYRGISNDLDLFSIARNHDIAVNGAHDAMSDAYIAAQLFQRFLVKLKSLGVVTLKDLIRVGKP